MMRRAQGALEYLFMLAAVLVLVAIAIKVAADSTNELNKSVTEYTKEIRKKILEDL
ncbi:class III signal peptide-containing protein [Thermococcus peptonophilus]|uniref:class III signal peptide-containing protein n=1 Tax=Thermococcus peptonophilus TaxID=53952 RepID=UPI0009EDECD6|nr:class III signal peptide-containing protein [Thermococcus peptonophilus]